MNPQQFTIERTLSAPIARVWKAITDSSELKEWFFDLPEFKPEVGLECQFLKVKNNNHYIHLFKITEVIVPIKLNYNWRYEGYEGNSHVTFELFDKGDKTTIKITHTGIDSFPKTNADLAAERFAEGWTYLLDKGLPEFLEKNM